MATITLYSSKINQMSSLINDVKTSIEEYKTELFALQKKSLRINKSVCSMDAVISTIQSSSQTQDRKLLSLEVLNRHQEEFVADAVAIDSGVADVVKQRKEDFYKNYSYLKPEHEKNPLDKIKDNFKGAGEWCREHWKALATIALAVVAVAVIVFFPALGAGLLAVIAKGILAGAAVGGIAGGIFSAVAGGSFWEGFEAGAFSGAIAGGISGGMGFGFTGGIKGAILTLKQTLSIGGVAGTACSLFGDLGDILFRGEDISFGKLIANMVVSGITGVAFAGIGYGISKAFRFLSDRFVRSWNNKIGAKIQGVGNPVNVAGRGSTGRTVPNTLNEQMAMHQVQSNPLEGATKVPLEMVDPRWPASEGWVKMQSIIQDADGIKTIIHFVFNEITGAFDDFKFK